MRFSLPRDGLRGCKDTVRRGHRDVVLYDFDMFDDTDDGVFSPIFFWSSCDSSPRHKAKLVTIKIETRYVGNTGSKSAA